jgi:hypothetical protein
MKRLLFLGACSVLAVGLALLFGCSTSTEPINKLAGDTTDATFLTAASVFEGAYVYDQEMIHSMFSMTGGIITPQAVPAPCKYDRVGVAAVVPPVAIYHEISQYWYIGVDTSLATDLDTTDFFFADSIQFLHGSTPVQYPDSALLTSVKYGAHLSLARKTVPDTIIVTQRATVTGAAGAIASRGTVQINALGTFHGHGENLTGPNDSLPTCTANFNFANSWNGVAVNIAAVMDSGACPTAGTMAHVGTLNVDCQNNQNSLQFTGLWRMVMTFSGTIATVVYESPTTRWTVTDTCGQRQVVAAPFARIPEIMGARR